MIAKVIENFGERMPPRVSTKSKEAESQGKEITFSLRTILKPTGGVSMQAVDKLLETTRLDALDTEHHQTLMEYACRTSDISLAKYCYRKGAVLTDLTATGESIVNIVTANKCYELMEFLLVYGIPINFGDGKGRTPLHTAAYHRDVDAICRLVELGADVNARDLDGRTPIHIATIEGHKDTIELLLELGGRLNEADNKGFTAVAHAELNDHFKLMDRLSALGGQGYKLAVEQRDHTRKYGVNESTLKTSQGVKLGQIGGYPLHSSIPSFLNRLGKYTPKHPADN